MIKNSSFATLAKRIRTKISLEALELAFLHSSYVNEYGDERGSNERLEFLGDAVLGLTVTSYLFSQFPDSDEGRLTKAKSVVVSRPVLCAKAIELNLPDYLWLGKGEEANGGRKRSSTLANAFEALIGVIFLERGYQAAAKFVVSQLKDEIDEVMSEQSATNDYKSLLQELAQRLFNCRPIYTVSEDKKTLEHQKGFIARIAVAGHRGKGRGRSKKQAEQAAAKQLYLILEEF
ncbi:ribonuclease III [Candidatus Bipolaricaulota bacterium]|nr:ribonuclease III [Candidatus Bipolaricaulota bacterium]HBR10360.1 ribonuclease III [Candidatus Acetothermia bacterium]